MLRDASDVGGAALQPVHRLDVAEKVANRARRGRPAADPDGAKSSVQIQFGVDTSRSRPKARSSAIDSLLITAGAWLDRTAARTAAAEESSRTGGA